MHAGSKIKYLVNKNKMSAKELAEKLGKHEKHMYNLFKQQHISTELLEQLAHIFNVDITYFCTDDNVVSEPESRYEKKDLRDKLIASQEREIEYLRLELEKLKSCCAEQKTKAC